MKKTLRTFAASVLVCAAALFAIVACEKDEKSAPGAPGAINGATANVCPAVTVDLSVAAVEGATAYKWYNGATAVGTGQSYTVTASGTYTVAGVNDQGEGAKSPAKVVTISACAPAAAGTITGDAENTCPAVTVELTVSAIADAISYQWYNGTEAIPGATGTAYIVDESGTYTVAGVNAIGEGPKSAAHVVTISECLPGEISGPNANPCPALTVELTVNEIPDATSYKWYKDNEALPDATATTYTVTESGTYTVAGVYATGEGPKSAEHPVTISNCPAGAAGTITFAPRCPEAGVLLTAGPIANAVSYQWYFNDAPITDATASTYIATVSGSYRVAGLGNDEEEGEKSPYQNIQVTPCVPDKPAAVQYNYKTASSVTSCNLEGANTVTLNGRISARATSYTWYIIKSGTDTTELDTRVYNEADLDNVLKWTATETGTYTTKGKNQWGASEASTGIYFEIVDVASCPSPGEAGSITVSSGVLNGDVYNNNCPNVATVNIRWNAISSATSYVVTKTDGSGSKDSIITGTTFQIKLGKDGTYTVKGRNFKGDGAVSTNNVVAKIVECPLPAPYLTKKPTANLCPATSVVWEIDGQNNAASFTLYKDGSSAQTIGVGSWNPGSFTITQSGSYTVKAVSASGLEGTASEEVVVTITSCGSAITTLNQLTGTWNVVDKKAHAFLPTVEDWAYTVTIAENSGALTIGGFANNGSGGATITATVDFTTANTERYGTITIPEQPVTNYGGAAVTATFSKMSKAGFLDPWTYGGDVTADIVGVGGKAYFKLKDKFAIKPADADPLVKSHQDNPDALAAFTKQ